MTSNDPQAAHTLSETDRLNADAALTAMARALEQSDRDLRDLAEAAAPAIEMPGDQAAATAALALLLSQAYRERAGGDAPVPAAGAAKRDMTIIPQVLTAAQPYLVPLLIGAAVLLYRRNIGGLIDRLREIGVTVKSTDLTVEVAAKFDAEAQAAEAVIGAQKKL